MLKALALLAALCATMPAANAIPTSPIATTPMRMGILAAPVHKQLRAIRGGGGKSVEPPAPPPRSSLPFLLRIASMLSMYVLACWMEHFLAAKVLARHLPGLLAPSPVLGGVVSTAYGGVILINVVASSFMMLYLSFIPGGARKKYMEAAKKKGDRDAEARFSLPKLYAEGFSQEAKEFNCCQRAHQQALETYANFVVCSLVGGVRQPFLTTGAGILYLIARIKWAQVGNLKAQGRFHNIFSSACMHVRS